MHPWRPPAKTTVFAMLLLAPALASAQTFKVPADALGGDSWKARIELETRSPVSLSGLTFSQPPFSQSLYVYGDYQFSSWRLGNGGGLRLTSGLIFNARASALNYAEYDAGTALLPYAGIGYSAGSANTSWGWSADLGFTANGVSALRLDRLLSGSANLSADGNLRLSPQIRLGMRLQF
jgi:hypothetical protein